MANPPPRFLPITKLGSAACWLALAFLVLLAGVASLSFQFVATPAWLRAVGGVAFAAAIAGGVCAVIALVRQGERAVLVWIALLPALFAIGFLLFAE